MCTGKSVASQWLMFVEDPGAAIYARFLPTVVKQHGINLTVVAAGHAVPYFEGQCTVWRGSEDAGQLLDTLQPNLVLLGTSENPDTFAFALRHAAAQRAIPTVGIVDSVANASERFKGRTADPLAHAPSWIVVPDEVAAGEFVKLGFAAERVQVCGHPQFDDVLQLRAQWTVADRRCQRERWLAGARPDRPVLVFIAEISTGLNAEQFQRSPSYTLAGQQDSAYRTEVVIDALFQAATRLQEKPYMVLRLHPKQALSDLPRHHALFDQVSDKSEPALELVNAADMVVGMTSMLLLEASLLGRPALSVVPRAEERLWLGPMGASIPCVWTQERLEAVLPELMTPVQSDRAVAKGAKARVMEFLTRQFQ